MGTVRTSHPCEALIQIAAVEEFLDDFFDYRAQKPQFGLETGVVILQEAVKMVVHAAP